MTSILRNRLRSREDSAEYSQDARKNPFPSLPETANDRTCSTGRKAGKTAWRKVEKTTGQINAILCSSRWDQVKDTGLLAKRFIADPEDPKADRSEGNPVCDVDVRFVGNRPDLIGLCEKRHRPFIQHHPVPRLAAGAPTLGHRVILRASKPHLGVNKDFVWLCRGTFPRNH